MEKVEEHLDIQLGVPKVGSKGIVLLTDCRLLVEL